ncbi:hypothetical protein GOBAR_DD06771 [Gossypium barbadense]|nr:hypothetical protein GOBAR_DD06771 [Gossypium barbadense]
MENPVLSHRDEGTCAVLCRSQAHSLVGMALSEKRSNAMHEVRLCLSVCSHVGRIIQVGGAQYKDLQPPKAITFAISFAIFLQIGFKGDDCENLKVLEVHEIYKQKRSLLYDVPINTLPWELKFPSQVQKSFGLLSVFPTSPSQTPIYHHHWIECSRNSVFEVKSVPSRGFSELKHFLRPVVMRLATERGVVLFSKSSCCLCYAVKILFQELGVTPTIHEIDQDPEGREMERALMRLGCKAPVPAVFIGGKLVGSTNEVMSLHLGGGLIPLLRPYQALC